MRSSSTWIEDLGGVRGGQAPRRGVSRRTNRRPRVAASRTRARPRRSRACSPRPSSRRARASCRRRGARSRPCPWRAPRARRRGGWCDRRRSSRASPPPPWPRGISRERARDAFGSCRGAARECRARQGLWPIGYRPCRCDERARAHRDPVGAVRVRRLQAQRYLPRVELSKARLGERGPEQVAAEVLQPIAPVGRHQGRRVEAEGFEARLDPSTRSARPTSKTTSRRSRRAARSS